MSTQLALRKRNHAAGLCRCGATPRPTLKNCDKCIARVVVRNRRQMAACRQTVFSHYGQICVHCGITEPQFLSLDHIHGGGREHMKSVGYGRQFYKWVISNNYPSILQVLCFNCNCGKERAVPATSEAKSRHKLRIEVIAAYGGKCPCPCGESKMRCLTLDHVNNDGAAHRKSIGYACSASTYRWARSNNYPASLRVLCWNCNMSRQIYAGGI